MNFWKFTIHYCFNIRYSIFIIIALLIPVITQAQSAEEIQSKIDSRSADIQSLQKEIDSYQSQINELGTKASSLADTLKSLDLTQKKLEADIALTQDKIDAKTFEIQQLTTQIGGTQNDISDDKRYTAESFRSMNEMGSQSFFSLLIGGKTLADGWYSVNQLSILEDRLFGHINSLSKAKNKLESNRRSTEKAKADLLALQDQLNDQKKVVIQTHTEQNKLLADTQNSEAAFQSLLEQKTALKNAFEKELSEYESDLKLTVDLSKLPRAQAGLLSWPVDNVRITQYFGDTPFATQNPQLYSGKGHNGVDFRASIGTPVKAALDGTVVGTGNTDLVPACYSLGKWMLIRHADGLSTLYAHLSVQSANVGDSVITGQVIGYSGNTGFTTGPHLHFGVYASSGIEIKQFTNSQHCQNAVLPIAVLKAYLNPLSYLPSYSN